MGLLIFLILFNGLYGYILHDIPTNNSKINPLDIKIQYYPSEDKLIAETADGTIYLSQIYESREDDDTPDDDGKSVDKWSIVWYIASFGGLIAFFLIVSCSEWCCRRNTGTGSSRNNSQTASAPVTPPPSYDQFAPPSYDSLNCGRDGEKREFDVYVVPVHALGTMLSSPNQADDDPPSYVAVRDSQLPSPSLNPPIQPN